MPGSDLHDLPPPTPPAVDPLTVLSTPTPYSGFGLSGLIVHRLIGRGGMGAVYEAMETATGRPVAVKILHGGGLADDSSRARFQREAEVVARLTHPNIVRLYRVGDEAGTAYIVMEYVGGGTLARPPVPLDPRQVATLLATVADAVHHAHAHGVVHRDLKPENVLLALDGTPKVADFGLARMFDGDALTHTGIVVGTPEYIPPEQLWPNPPPPNPRLDVYGLGGLLYHALTGRMAFGGSDITDVLRRVALFDPVPPRRHNPAVPVDLEVICLKCLEKAPNLRYESAAAVAADLRRFLAGDSVLARPLGRPRRWARLARRNPIALAGLLAVAVAAATVGLAVRSSRQVAQAEQTTDQVRRHAEAETDRAAANLAVIRDAVRATVARLKTESRFDDRFTPDERKRRLDECRPLFDRFLAEKPDAADVLAEQAEVNYWYGQLQETVRALADAAPYYRAAADLYLALAARRPDEPAYRAHAGRTLSRLGFVLTVSGDRDAGDAAHRQAIGLLDAAAAADPNRSEPVVWAAMARLHRNAGRSSGGPADATAAAALAADAYCRFGPTFEVLELWADTRLAVGTAAYRQQRYAAAIPLLSEAETAFDELIRIDPPRRHVYAARQSAAASCRALCAGSLGRLDEAAAALDRAVAVIAPAAGENPSILVYQYTLCNSLALRGRHRAMFGTATAAAADLAAAADILNRLETTDPNNVVGRNLRTLLTTAQRELARRRVPEAAPPPRRLR